MKAKELSEILMKNPEFEVTVLKGFDRDDEVDFFTYADTTKPINAFYLS